MKISAGFSVVLSMIGQDRLNICLKQFTGGSQSHYWPPSSTIRLNTSNLYQPVSCQWSLDIISFMQKRIKVLVDQEVSGYTFS